MIGVIMIKTFKKFIATVLCAVLLLPLSLLSVKASQSFLKGDVNRDFTVSAADARLILRYSVDLEVYSVGHLKLGDMNGDGSLTAADARTVLRISVGLDKSDGTSLVIKEEDFEIFINAPVGSSNLFEWVLPDMPSNDAPSGTFKFTVYGYGHGVGLSQYGAMSLDEAGYTYKEILAHYYTGTQTEFAEEIPATCLYPTLVYVEELQKETYVKKEQPVKELLARIVYQEIYGVTQNGKYKEALKALTVCVFSLLAYHDFDIDSRWDVGIASVLSYEQLPENLKQIVDEVFGCYITVRGEHKPIMAVFSGLAAGKTASSQSIWGGELSYLTSVDSPFDMKRDGFVSEYIYTVDEMYSLIKKYDSSIELSENPEKWLQIIEHTASMDENRGYVTKIRVGNKVLNGYSDFHMRLMGNTFRSSCFVITYTP